MVEKDWTAFKAIIERTKTITDRQALELTAFHAKLYSLNKPRIPCRSCPKEWRKLIKQVDMKLKQILK